MRNPPPRAVAAEETRSRENPARWPVRTPPSCQGGRCLDVNSSGPGNSTTTFGPFFVSAQTLSGQRLRVVITGPSSTPRPMVYNGGTHFVAGPRSQTVDGGLHP
jgi:hypothetical protein